MSETWMGARPILSFFLSSYLDLKLLFSIFVNSELGRMTIGIDY
jgi:hypothetical protein